MFVVVVTQIVCISYDWCVVRRHNAPAVYIIVSSLVFNSQFIVSNSLFYVWQVTVHGRVVVIV